MTVGSRWFLECQIWGVLIKLDPNPVLFFSFSMFGLGSGFFFKGRNPIRVNLIRNSGTCRGKCINPELCPAAMPA